MARFLFQTPLLILYTSLCFRQSAFAQEFSCPSSFQAWADFRKETLKPAVQLGFDVLIRESGREIKECEADPRQSAFFSNPEFNRCMKPLRDAAAYAISEGGDDSSAVDVSIKDYYDVKKADFAESLSLPDEIKNLDKSSPDSILNGLQKLKKKYPDAEVISRKPGNELILIPGANVDRWFNIRDSSETLLAVSVQKKSKDGKDLDPPKSYFYQATLGKIDVQGFSPTACVTCHRTGAMPPYEHTDQNYALAEYFPGDDVKRVQAAMLKRIDDTATAAPAHIRHAGFGPAIGDSKTPRSQAFLQSCSTLQGKPLAVSEIQKMVKAMSCTDCHDGSSAGAITAPISRLLLRGLVENGHMPPGADDEKSAEYLKPATRLALYNCLQEEYYGSEKHPEDGLLLKSFLVHDCPLKGASVVGIDQHSKSKRGEELKHSTSESTSNSDTQAPEAK